MSMHLFKGVATLPAHHYVEEVFICYWHEQHPNTKWTITSDGGARVNMRYVARQAEPPWDEYTRLMGISFMMLESHTVEEILVHGSEVPNLGGLYTPGLEGVRRMNVPDLSAARKRDENASTVDILHDPNWPLPNVIEKN